MKWDVAILLLSILLGILAGYMLPYSFYPAKARVSDIPIYVEIPDVELLKSQTCANSMAMKELSQPKEQGCVEREGRVECVVLSYEVSFPPFIPPEMVVYNLYMKLGR